MLVLGLSAVPSIFGQHMSARAYPAAVATGQTTNEWSMGSGRFVCSMQAAANQ